MKVVRTLEGALRADRALAIGKFDGMHLGHQGLLNRLVSVAREQKFEAAVLTFDRNPLALFAPDDVPPSLLSESEKLDRMAQLGVDTVFIATFDRSFAAIAPTVFVEDVLIDKLNAKHVLVGGDFRFGAHAEGDVEFLRTAYAKHGLTVEGIADVGIQRRISSTQIRDLLYDGDIEAATELLGRAPRLRGEVVHGAARGRELGFPTANLSPKSEGCVPKDGVYAGWFTANGMRYSSAISVGNNPTFEGVPQKQVEAHVIDETLDLYGQVVDVDFVKRIRGQVAFTTVEALIETIRSDVDLIRELLAAEASSVQ